MSPSHVLGIDPGLSGALCLLSIQAKAIEGIFDMPVTGGQVDPAKLAAIVDQLNFQTNRHIHAAVELVSSMPRQAGAFNFGRSAGVVHGVLGALGVPYTLVSPNVWKGATGLHRMSGESQADVKSRARFLAQKLWPEQAAQFKRIKDDGRAEAALLARYFANKQGWL
jgi:crossover junction endodeoxyribonuclease RuvC